MKGFTVSHGPNGHCLPLEERLHAYNEALHLHRQGLSHRNIVKSIHGLLGIRITTTHVRDWVNGEHHPLGNVNKFDSRPSPTLTYVIGVKASDGYIYKHGRGYEFGLRVIDFEYAAKTGRCLAKLIGRKEPYWPRWIRSQHRWHVTCRSILLYRFLEQPFEKLRHYIEHCKYCIAAFLRAFCDGEASIKGRALRVYNTDRALLLYVQRLLRRYFGIGTTGPHTAKKAGYRFRDPRNGKIYRTRKTIYYLYTYVQDLRRFHQYIGFSIKRKQRRVIQAIQT